MSKTYQTEHAFQTREGGRRCDFVVNDTDFFCNLLPEEHGCIGCGRLEVDPHDMECPVAMGQDLEDHGYTVIPPGDWTCRLGHATTPPIIVVGPDTTPDPNERVEVRYCPTCRQEIRSTPDKEVPVEPEVETIVITPHWPSTTRWFARALADHSFERASYGVMSSLIEQVRYLQQTDPDELQRIIDELK